MVGIYTALTRANLDGSDAWIPEETLDLASTVRAYTIGGARACFAEADRGSVTVGKYADLVVLSADLFALEAEPRRITRCARLPHDRGGRRRAPHLTTRAGSDRKDTKDETADREHLLDPRWRHAGPGWTGRGRQRRLRARWLVGEPLGRADGAGHGRGGERAVGFFVLGRKTYDIVAAYWPHASDDAGARPFNDATKYVASRSHPTLEWSTSVLIEGDVAEGIEALKDEDGPELQVHGSGDLDPDAVVPRTRGPVPPVDSPS